MTRTHLADFCFSTGGPGGLQGLVVHLLHVDARSLDDSYLDASLWNVLHAEGFKDLDYVRLGSVAVAASGEAQVWYDDSSIKGGTPNLWYYLTEEALDDNGRSNVRFICPEIRSRAALVENFRVRLKAVGLRNAALPASVSGDFPEGPGTILAKAAERLPKTLRRSAIPAEAKALARQRKALQEELGVEKVADLTAGLKLICDENAPTIARGKLVAMANRASKERALGQSDESIRLRVGEDGQTRLILPRVPDRLVYGDD